MSRSRRRDGRKNKEYCILRDGELGAHEVDGPVPDTVSCLGTAATRPNTAGCSNESYERSTCRHCPARLRRESSGWAASTIQWILQIPGKNSLLRVYRMALIPSQTKINLTNFGQSIKGTLAHNLEVHISPSSEFRSVS